MAKQVIFAVFTALQILLVYACTTPHLVKEFGSTSTKAAVRAKVLKTYQQCNGNCETYYDLSVTTVYKGCNIGTVMSVKLDASAEKCGMTMTVNEEYFLILRQDSHLATIEAGMYVQKWASIGKDIITYFLNKLEVCCDKKCSCAAGTVNCLVSPCTIYSSACSRVGKKCVDNFCGGCNYRCV